MEKAHFEVLAPIDSETVSQKDKDFCLIPTAFSSNIITVDQGAREIVGKRKRTQQK